MFLRQQDDEPPGGFSPRSRLEALLPLTCFRDFASPLVPLLAFLLG
jgi:hypothetical protein